MRCSHTATTKKKILLIPFDGSGNIYIHKKKKNRNPEFESKGKKL